MAGKESHAYISSGEKAAKGLRNLFLVGGIIGLIAALCVPAGTLLASGATGTTVFELTRRSIHAKNNPGAH